MGIVFPTLDMITGGGHNCETDDACYEFKSIFRIWEKFDFRKFSGSHHFEGSGCMQYKCTADGMTIWRLVA